MRLGRPVNQKFYPLKYDPIRGRRSVQEDNGFFKSTARFLGLQSVLGYDPKEDTGLMVNKPVTRAFEGLKVISPFLRKFNNKTSKEFNITQENGNKYINIGSDITAKHRVCQRGGSYYLIVKKDYNPHNYKKSSPLIPIRIKADDDNEFKEKLGWILSQPVSRAKLDYIIPRLPGMSKKILKPGHGRYIDFNEHKVVGNFRMQEFTTIGNPGLAEGYSSEIGGTDFNQINYFGPLKSYQGYSSLKDGKPFKQIDDRFWARVHGMTEHLLAGNIADELLGNIVNMFYAGKTLSPEHRAQVVRNAREDFIFNLHGKGSRNSRVNQETPDLFAAPNKFQNFFSQFSFGANPLRGGRYWRELPPSLSQVVDSMYKPTGDGKVKDIYDENPDEYLKNLRKLKITPADKQYLGAYSRKILGIYIALKFLHEDISHIKIESPKISEKDKKKWRDLTKIHDELFKSAGDLKDFLRHNSSGFTQTVHSITNHDIPALKNADGTLEQEKPVTDQENYTGSVKKTLFPLMMNYSQFENYIGWHSRERGSSILYNTLKKQIFNREVPDIVAGAATVIMLEGLDKISRRLRFIDEVIGRDSNLNGFAKHIGNKLKQGEIEGAYVLAERQLKRTTHALKTETLFPNSKFQSMQTEGMLWEQEPFKPIIREYQSENQNFFLGNHMAADAIAKNGMILTAKLVEAIKVQARFFTHIQKEMKEKNLSSPYDTKNMEKLAAYMRKSAKEVALDFMHEHRTYFNNITDAETQKIFRDVLKETYALQQLVSNVAAILATSSDTYYGPQAQKEKKDIKRNHKLAHSVKTISPVLNSEPLTRHQS